MSDQPTADPTRIAKKLVRWGLFGVVVWFVYNQAREQWVATQDVDLSVNFVWLIPAALIYVVSWFPSIWFWDRLIVRFNQRAPLLPLVRSYYCGMLGKYVPGKAAVILIRAAMLKPYGVSAVRAGIASMVEAGAVMLIGLVVSVAFAATVIPQEAIPQAFPDVIKNDSVSWMRLAVAIVIAIAGIPVLTVPTNKVFSVIARMIAKREASNEQNVPSEESAAANEDSAPRLRATFLITSSLLFTLCWAGQGLALLIVAQSVGFNDAGIESWAVCTMAASAGTAIGFFALFAPGGLAIREGLIIAALEPSMGGAVAVAAAVLLRLTSLAAECLTAGVLYMLPTSQQLSEQDK